MSSIESTLKERGARYGAFHEHAKIAQALKDAMWHTDGWTRLAADQKQALEVIADKVARVLNGDPTYHDNWHDIVGYAKLVADRLQPAAVKAVETAQDKLSAEAVARRFYEKDAQQVATKRPTSGEHGPSWDEILAATNVNVRMNPCAPHAGKEFV
jgi:hypothetical protein